MLIPIRDSGTLLHRYWVTRIQMQALLPFSRKICSFLLFAFFLVSSISSPLAAKMNVPNPLNREHLKNRIEQPVSNQSMSAPCHEAVSTDEMVAGSFSSIDSHPQVMECCQEQCQACVMSGASLCGVVAISMSHSPLSIQFSFPSQSVAVGYFANRYRPPSFT